MMSDKNDGRFARDSFAPQPANAVTVLLGEWLPRRVIVAFRRACVTSRATPYRILLPHARERRAARFSTGPLR
jgi:hypothetical protein